MNRLTAAYRFSLVFLGVILAAVTLMGCSSTAASQAEPTRPASVQLPETTVSASAEVIPARRANLGFINGGDQLKLLVAAGDVVQAGQVLAQVNPTALESAAAQAQAAYQRAELALQQLQDLPSAEAVAAAEAALANAEVNLDRLKRAEARTIEQDAAQLQIDSAQASLDALNAGASEQQLAAARTDLSAARLALEQANAALDAAELRAPFAGTVIEVYARDFETVSPGQSLILLADLTTLQVETTDLSEVDASRVQVGDTVQVSFDALPDRTVTGKVVQIAEKASAGAGVYYTTFVALDEIPAGLRWGMSAFVIIQIE